MDRLPNIGERVRFRSTRLREWEKDARECTGAVRRVYPGSRCVDPDDEDSAIVDVPVGAPGWTESWQVSMEVDEPLPAWWQYAGTNRFAPNIAELEPLD